MPLAPLIAALAVVAPTAALADAPLTEIDFDTPRTVALVLAIGLLTVLVVGAGRLRRGEALRNVLLILALLIALVGVHTFRHDLLGVGREMLAAVAPGLAVEAGEEVIVRRSGDGTFKLDGAVGDAPVEFTFDTGASAVVLSAEDAERAGFAMERLDFRVPVMTASGPARVAPVTIDELSIGPITLDNVRAAVARPGDLDGSLLGMTFLNRLEGYSVRRDRLVLTP